MLKVIFPTTLFVMVIIPAILFGQTADSIQTKAAPSGISEEKVSEMLDSLRSELAANFAERENSLNEANEMKLDSLRNSLTGQFNIEQNSLRNSLTSQFNLGKESLRISLTDKFNIKQDSLKAAVTAELTADFEKKRDELNKSHLAETSSSRTSDNPNADNYYSFLITLADMKDKELFDDIVYELNNFTKLYWSGRHAEDVQLLLANLYRNKKMQHETIASYIKFIYLYPSSSKGDDARASLVSFISGKIDKKIKAKRDQLTRIAALPLQEKSYQAKYFDYIQALYNLEISKLNLWTLNEVNYFNSILPADERQSQIALWAANLHSRLNNRKESAVMASKVAVSYPNSPLVPDAFYLQAKIQTEKLGKHAEAVTNFLAVVDKYPTHSIAPMALFSAAKTQSEKSKKHSDAVQTIQRFIDEYPDDDNVVEAIFYAAKVLKDKIKDPSKARSYYHLVTTKYPNNPRGAEALEAAGNVAEDKLKDISSAIEDYIAVSDKYPRDERAVELLRKAADLQEKKQKNLTAAVNTLQKIVNNYSSYKDVKKIEKQISKLKEKIRKG